MATATITICVPTYEPKPEHLRQALQSLVGQTFQDWTAVIIDDASPKANVREMLGQYCSDERISFKRSDERRGIGGNWNACLAQAQSPLVQYLFQDDLWETTYLQRSAEVLLADPALVFTAANHDYRDDNGQAIGGRYGEIQAMRSTLLSGKTNGHDFLMHWIAQGLTPNIIGEPSFVMMRKAAMQQAGPFVEDMPQFLDVEYWTRLLQLGDWYGIGEKLGTFRVHPDGASARNDASGQGIFDRFRCFQRLITAFPGGPDRRAVIRARNKSLDSMIDKFLLRIFKRQHVSGDGKKTKTLQLSDYPTLIWGLVRYVFRAPIRVIGRMLSGKA